MMAQLNKEQYEASLPAGGVNLVLAGAGTGKTKTLVEKVKNIILHSLYKPENILILTFSRKAAGEIKNRVREDTGQSAESITSGTFHSFCLNFLRENRELFMHTCGFRQFPLILEKEQRDKIIHDILKSRLNRLKGLPERISADLINRIKNLNKETSMKLEKSELIGELQEIIDLFNEKKRIMSLIDFEDMIEFTIRLLKIHKDFRNKIISKFRYILIDEFQDTSDNNFELIKLLLPDQNPNLFAVGDDWQSIYGFRNARVEYIIRMKNFFPDVRIHKLTLNYRSRKEIIELSNRFIRRNRFRTRKRLISFKGKGKEKAVFCHSVCDYDEEAGLIGEIIAKDSDLSTDIAVLYRNNKQGEFIRENINPGADNADEINFMTMHASKGLEFDVVILAGISDKIIPNRITDIEEERRLFYVALTRAKERLHIIIHLNEDGEVARFGRELNIRAKRYREYT